MNITLSSIMYRKGKLTEINLTFVFKTVYYSKLRQ